MVLDKFERILTRKPRMPARSSLLALCLLVAVSSPPPPAMAQSAGVTLTTLTPSAVPEGGSATYTVVLDTAPTADVTITVANRGQSGDDSDLTVSPASLSFGASSWSTAQTVTVTAKQDSDVADGTATITHTATSTDSNYDNITISNLTATEDDDDTAGVTLSTTSLSVPEGGSATYTMRLATLPSATVYVDMARQAGGDGDLTFSPPQLVFTTKGWDLPQRVTVTAAQDNDAARGAATITHTATSTDTNYGSLTIASVTATEDDDELGVTVSKKSVSVPEGGSATWTVVLDGPPTHDVTIAVAKQTGGDGNLTVNPASLTFTTSNYNQAQTVTVSATQDNDDTNGAATITHTPTSTDSDFNGLAIASVTATEDDDDTPGVTLSKTSVSVTEGSSATYTVVLDTAPTHDVTIAVAKQTGGDADLTVAPASLTFGTANWSTAQTVTVSAAEDDSDDTDGAATITHTATSTDADYGGITIASVTATEDDDDTLAGVTLSKTRVSVTEGSSATYTVVLNTAPTADVTITVANRGQSADDSDLTVAPASLTFTNSDYSSAQTVTVSAAQDADTADGSAVITHTASSSDSNYGSSLTIADVTATEDDTAPTSANATLAVSRDNRTAIPLSRFTFSSEDGGALRGVKIVTLPGASAGTLGLVKTGIYAGAATVLCVGTITPIVAGQEVLDAVNSVLYFCPKNGFTHTTFRFQVIDSRGQTSDPYTATLVGPPGQVTGLEAEAGNGYVRLSWTDPENPAITGYEYRQKSGANDYGAWTAMTGSGATTTRYPVRSLTNATAYTFQVRARSKGGAGPVPSAAVTATPTSGTRPSKPTGLQVLHAGEGSSTGTSYAKVRLVWDDPKDPSITRYEVEREFSGLPDTWLKPIDWSNNQVPNSGPTTTSAEFEAGSHENSYAFRVRAVNAAGAGEWSDEVSLELDQDAGTAVLTALIPGNGRTRLQWTHIGPVQFFAGKYWGYRTNNVSDTTISGNQSKRSHVVSGLTNGSTYTYQVFSYGKTNADNATRVKRYSNARTITLPAAPAKPSGLTVKPTSAGATLSWTDPDNDDITGWEYQQKAGSNPWGSWSRVPGSDRGTTSFTVPGLTNGTVYKFKVRAVIEYETALGGDLAGTASDEVSVTPVGVVVSRDSLALTEGGTAGTYTVALSHAPTANVTITVSVDSDGSVTADTDAVTTGHQTTLTFTPTVYSAKTVTVTAAEDGDGRHSTATITHAAASTDTRYGNLASLPGLTVKVTDNDALGITLSTSSVEVTEDSTATYTVVLDSQPTGNVTVTIARNSGGDTDLTVDTDTGTAGDQNTLTFTTTNWSTTQTVTVAAAEDDGDALNGEATFTHTASGGGYAGVIATLTATEEDDDRGITLSTSSLSVPEGSTATYTVVLDSQPTGNVTVTITKATGGDADLTVDTDTGTTGNQSTLTFTTTNWSTTQTVTVAADQDDDALNGEATFTHTASGGGYAEVNASLTATEADNNERGIVLTPPDRVTVPEGGSTTYTVKLASQPSADVTVTIGRNTAGDTDLTVDTDPNTTGDQSTLTFTTTNWSTTQTVTVAAAEDDDDDNGTAEIGHFAAGGGYAGVRASLMATEADNERGIVLTPTSVEVPEGGTKTWTVKLASQPTGNVTVTITKATGGDADLTVDTDPDTTGNQSTLTFTTTNWSTTQTVTVAADQDDDALNGEATFTHTASGGGYAGVRASLMATEADNERGIVLTPTSVEVPEGGTKTWTVKLASQPTGNVTVTIAKATGGDADLTVDTDPDTTGNQSTLTFTTTNWSTTQTVTVAADQDDDALNGEATFTHTASGGGYAEVNASLTATEADNERGITLSKSSVKVPEGSTATYTVVLDSQPTGNVTVTITKATGDDADLTVDTDTLTFTTTNWSTTQTVTVTAAEDNNDALNGEATFTHTASGGGYGGVRATLTATEADNDREEDNERGITLSASSVTAPEGGTKTWTVKLASQPSADVTVTIARNSTGDADLTVDTDTGTAGDQNTLTFTTTNWSTTQTVTVAAAEDDDGIDGEATFTHTASGGGYAGVSATLTATEADNDRRITLSKSSVTVPEGDTATYKVKLASQPSADVTVTIARNSTGDADLTVDTDTGTAGDQNTLTFTTTNWSTTQTVTVAAAEDDDGIDGEATFTHTASGGGYAGVSATLTATEADNDRRITLSKSSVTVPEGDTATYKVKLASQPSADVTVTIARNSTGDADLTVDTDTGTTGDQNTLTFTTTNWSTTQTVTVKAAEDNNDALNGEATFTHTASGGGYAGVSADLAATEADNDREADDDRAITLSRTHVTVPEGETATWTVALAAEPDLDVTVTLARDPGGDPDLTVDTDPETPGDQSTLTFTTRDWSTPRTVTVAAAADPDGIDGAATFTHTASGGPWAGSSATVAATEADDDRAITLSRTHVTVPEGETATWTVALAAEPDLDVTVTLARDPGGDPDLTVDTDPETPGDQSTLTFTTRDWSTPRTVTVAAAADPDGIDGAATFTHTASGGPWAGSSATVAATEADDDRAITLSRTHVTVPEGETATWTVALAAEPDLDVTVTLARDPGGDPDLTVDTDPETPGDQSTLTFTTRDWSTPRTVTVAAAADPDGIDGAATFTHTASGGPWAGSSATVAATEADDDRAITLSRTHVTVPEGETATWTVALAAEPDLDVTVTLARDPGGDPDLTVDTDPETPGGQSTLTFTTSDWSTPRTVTVAAAADPDGIDGAATFTHTASGGPWAGSSATVAATEADDDRAITLSRTHVTVPEGETATWTVALAAEPDLDVTVTLARDPGGDPDLTVDTDPETPGDQSTLTFTTRDWSTPRTVTVAAAADPDGIDGAATFTHTASGGPWAGSSATIEVTEKDEPAPVAVGELPALTLFAGGEPRTVDVSHAFRGPNLRYAVRSSREESVAASIEDARLTLTPHREGQAQVTVTVRNRTGRARQAFTATVVTSPAEKAAVRDGLAAIGRGMLSSIDMALGARLRGRSSEGVRVGGYALEPGDVEAMSGPPREVSPDAGPEREEESLVLDWLDRTSFAVALGADAEEGAGVSPRWTLWGEGDLQSFGSDRSSVDGETRTVYLGLDAGQGDDWLLGAVASHSEGRADYAFEGEGGSGSGRLRTTVTSLHPYLRWRPWSSGSAWATLGLGRGRVENRRDRLDLTEQGDLSMFVALGGGRYALTSEAGPLDVALLGDLAFLRLRTETDTPPGSLDDVSASVERLRLGLEGSYEIPMGGGGAVAVRPDERALRRRGRRVGQRPGGLGRGALPQRADVVRDRRAGAVGGGWRLRGERMEPRAGARPARGRAGAVAVAVAHLGRGAASRAGGAVASGRALGPGRRAGGGRRRPRDADKHRLRPPAAGLGGADRALCRARALLVGRSAHRHGGCAWIFARRAWRWTSGASSTRAPGG